MNFSVEGNEFLVYNFVFMDIFSRKILVVDDNREFADFLKTLLESKDFGVSVAPDGRTAIEKAASDAPELVLLDLKLPDIPGEEVLKRIKEINRNIAIVVITGFGGQQVAVDMMRRGATDFLLKPIEQEALLSSVKNALEIRDAQLEDRAFDRYPSLERFFPFLAHEIRNPLHAISGALAIIQRRSDPKDSLLGQSMKIINEEVQHLNDFVQECLNFVKPPNTVRFVEVDANEIVSGALNIVSHMFEAESKKIKVTMELYHELPRIYAQYEEIKQAFLNIAKNAFEAMPEGGEFIIRTRRQSDSPRSLEIIFADSGTGVKKENLDKLFSPFFTTKPRGTGLGLAICRRIITERHRGRIYITSEEGKGTTVTVELPIGRRLGDVPGVK